MRGGSIMSIPVIFKNENDQLLWSTASALKHIVASNVVFSGEAWAAFRHELQVINDCIPHREEMQAQKEEK